MTLSGVLHTCPAQDSQENQRVCIPGRMIRIGDDPGRDDRRPSGKGRISPAPFRHSGLDLSLPRSAVRPFFRHSGLDPESILSERDGGRVAGKNRNISGDLQPINMDPGSSPGVTEEGETDPGVTGERREPVECRDGVQKMSFFGIPQDRNHPDA